MDETPVAVRLTLDDSGGLQISYALLKPTITARSRRRIVYKLAQ
jgi:hypothetical protein